MSVRLSLLWKTIAQESFLKFVKHVKCNLQWKWYEFKEKLLIDRHFEIKKKKKKTSFIQLIDKHIFHHQELATSFRWTSANEEDLRSFFFFLIYILAAILPFFLARGRNCHFSPKAQVFFWRRKYAQILQSNIRNIETLKIEKKYYSVIVYPMKFMRHLFTYIWRKYYNRDY